MHLRVCLYSYPAGHIWVYRVLHFFTDSGKDIRQAQYIFQGFYLLNLVFVFRILYKVVRIPPVVLFLVTVTGYRIHSIFMLRLFNDPLAMLLFYVALDMFLEEKWFIGCVLYSLAVSIKMNVLLFAPALFVTLLLNTDIWSTIGYIGVCGVIQLNVGGPFLLHDWKSYVTRSFDLGRVFMFKWTVNWRFLPEELFLDKRFHISLLVGHLTFLAVFAWFMWYRRMNGLWPSVSLALFRSIPTITGPLDVVYAFYTSNLIGITFSRSLHYQFYSWYFHQLPFLLFCNYPQNVNSISTIPWTLFFWKVPLLLAVELAWNVYPSKWWSSALLHTCHIVILSYLIYTRPTRPIDTMTKETEMMLRQREKRLKKCYEEHGTLMPPMKTLTREETLEKRKKLEQKLSKSPQESELAFEHWYAKEMLKMREDYRVYYGKDGEKEVAGLPPLGDRTKLEFHEKVKLLYAEALELEEKLKNKDASESQGKRLPSSTHLDSENSDNSEPDEAGTLKADHSGARRRRKIVTGKK
uniref:dolichyl-P-Man:Man5GlcNAc2-PP-dolichol alpha-1,3-mannosyltransferase n=2 Tax=Caenorhabditis japonica TaxID=281687 RepID=A0A8R1DNP6_CAEJA